MKAYVAPILLGLSVLYSGAFASGKFETALEESSPHLSLVTPRIYALEVGVPSQFLQGELREARQKLRSILAESLEAKEVEINRVMHELTEEGKEAGPRTDRKSLEDWNQELMHIRKVRYDINASNTVRDLNNFIIFSLLSGKQQPYRGFDLDLDLMGVLDKLNITLDTLCDPFAADGLKGMPSQLPLTREEKHMMSPVIIPPILWEQFNAARLQKASEELRSIILGNLEADKREVLKLQRHYQEVLKLVSTDEKLQLKVKQAETEFVRVKHKGVVYGLDKYDLEPQSEAEQHHTQEINKIDEVIRSLNSPDSADALKCLLISSLLAGKVQPFLGHDVSSGVGGALYRGDITLFSLLQKK